MKDKTKEKIKKYTAAAASTVAGEAVGLAMGELLSTEDMTIEDSSSPSRHNIREQLVSEADAQDIDTPIEQEESDNVKNEVEVLAVVSNTSHVAQQSFTENEVAVAELNEDTIDSENIIATVYDEEPEVEATTPETITAENQPDGQPENDLNQEDVIAIVEEEIQEPQSPVETEIPVIDSLEGITTDIISADSNGMPDYVNNANVDDFMA